MCAVSVAFGGIMDSVVLFSQVAGKLKGADTKDSIGCITDLLVSVVNEIGLNSRSLVT